MKAIAFAVLCALSGFVHVDPPQEIEKLTKDLGSPEFAKREAASKRLGEIGAPAVEAIRKALTSPDPEVRSRARELLNGSLRNAAMQSNRTFARIPAPRVVVPVVQAPNVKPIPKVADRGPGRKVSWRDAYVLWRKDHSKGRETLETIKQAGREMEGRLRELGTDADVQETRAMLLAAMEISAAK